MSRRFAVVIGVASVVMTASGCVSWQQVKLKTDVENLKQEVARLKKQNGAGGSSSLNDLRARVADVSASLEELRTEIGLLGGRIEAAQHAGDENAEELKKVKKDLETKLARLEEKMVMLEASLGSGNARPSPTPASGNATPTPTPAEASKTPAPRATPLAAESDEAIYRRAITLMDGEKYGQSRGVFNDLIKRYPKSQLADNARFWIGETYYREKEYATSILEYQKVVEQYPKGDKVPAALYKQGLAFLAIGEKEGGLATLQQLVTKYPKTREARLAKDAITKAKK